jgi:hypothetical protein
MRKKVLWGFTPCKNGPLIPTEASEKIPWRDVRYMAGGHFKLESEIFYRRPWTKIQFFYFHRFLAHK